MRWRSSDHGAGSALALGVVAALAIVTTVLLPFTLLMPLKHRVKDAADAAALAAADVAVGLVPGAPCEVAAAVAEANGAAMTACEVNGLLATVTAGVLVLGLPVTATSTAGPPVRELVSSDAFRGTPWDASLAAVCMVSLSGDDNSAPNATSLN